MRGDELILEWRRLGNVLALALFDPVHFEEVVVTGPASVPPQALERLARAKLARRLARARNRPKEPPAVIVQLASGTRGHPPDQT